MSPKDIRDLVEFALAKGAHHIRVGEFEMALPMDMPRVIPQGLDEGPYDPDEDRDIDDKKDKRAAVELLTHSG